MTAQTNATTRPTPAQTSTLTAPIGVLDIDGQHLHGQPLVPVQGAIRHVGDLYNGARRHRLTQLGGRQRFLHFGAISHKQRQVGPDCRISDSKTVAQSRKVSPERSFRDERTALYRPLDLCMMVIAVRQDVNEALKLVTEMV